MKPIAASLFASMCLLCLPAVAEKEVLDWEALKKGPPEGLAKAAETVREDLMSLSVYHTAEKKRMFGVYRGFNISKDGLALFPLKPLCMDYPRVFSFGDPSKGHYEVKDPVVIGVFEDLNLALVQFDHKLRRYFSLSKEPLTLGQWVSVVTSPEFGAVPVGPILNARGGVDEETVWLKKRPKELLTYHLIGAPTMPQSDMAYRTGEPVLNSKGEVVGIMAVSVHLNDVVYRNCISAQGLEERIAKAVAAGKKSKLPISGDLNPYDPAFLDELFGKASWKITKGLYDEAEELWKELAAKYPDSRHLKEYEAAFHQQIMLHKVQSGHLVGQEVGEGLVGVWTKLPPADDAPAWEKANYHINLATAHRFAQQRDEAIEHYKKANALLPESMACMSLAEMYREDSDHDLHEKYLREAIVIEPTRPSFWNELSRNPNVDFSDAMRMQDKCDQLIKLFRGR